MNMTLEDSRLLAELCEQRGVSADKVLKLTRSVPRPSNSPPIT